jgi:hypothetical protein
LDLRLGVIVDLDDFRLKFIDWRRKGSSRDREIQVRIAIIHKSKNITKLDIIPLKDSRW